MRLITRVLLLLAGALAAALALPAQAQDYPVRPIHIIVPLTPGGIATVFSRYLADQMGQRWNQSVIVDYKPGAGGLLGMDMVSKSEPDGYTLGISSDSAAAYRLFVKGVTFDPRRDLTAVSMIVKSPYVLQTPAQVPVHSMREFIDYVKARPGKLNMGMVPNGNGQLGPILFLKRAGLDMALIPYNGGTPNLTALVANETQLYFGNYGTSQPYIKAGKLTALAATSSERYFLAPDIPTLRESGVDMVQYFWFGLAAPPKTPAAIVNKLAGATAEIMKSPDAVEKMKAIGLEAVGSTAEELTRQVEQDSLAAEEAARLGGITPK